MGRQGRQVAHQGSPLTPQGRQGRKEGQGWRKTFHPGGRQTVLVDFYDHDFCCLYQGRQGLAVGWAGQERRPRDGRW